MADDERLAVELERSFAHPAQRVFDAWLDADHAGAWLFATPGGEMQRVSIDGWPGGQFLIVERRDGEDVAHFGQFEIIEPPRRIAFVFAVPQFSDEATRVALDIEPTPSGCRLRLVHTDVPADYAEVTGQGWITILQNLDAHLSQSAPT